LGIIATLFTPLVQKGKYEKKSAGNVSIPMKVVLFTENTTTYPLVSGVSIHEEDFVLEGNKLNVGVHSEIAGKRAIISIKNWRMTQVAFSFKRDIVHQMQASY
jgi:hypothetical protein